MHIAGKALKKLEDLYIINPKANTRQNLKDLFSSSILQTPTSKQNGL